MTTDLERRVVETGLHLYRLIEGQTPSIFRKEYWMGKIVQWCMQNEAFKTEMFRFVDVFPYLTRSESIARHLREYFCRPELDLPKALQWGLKNVSPSSLTAKMIARSMAKNIRNMAYQFIVGETPRDALPALEQLRAGGMAFTADLLGEAVLSKQEEQEYQARYLELLDLFDAEQQSWQALGDSLGQLDWGFTPKINLSIKPSAMYSQMHPCAFEHSVQQAKERLRPIFRKAVAVGAFVGLDMEHHGLKDLSLALYKSLLEEKEFAGYPHTGLVIQAYLRESQRDVDELVRWAQQHRQPVTVRLVKGAYWDAEVIWARQKNWPIPVFTNKHETDANFERLARRLMENHRWITFACASHNIRSIAYVMELAKELAVPPDRIEYQILYGMAEPVRTALGKAGLPLRLYCPMGELIPGMAYLVRRLLENTSNESFLRLTFSEGVSREELLKNPLDWLEPDHGNEPASSGQGPEQAQDPPPFANEPHFDWTIAEHRSRFATALEQWPQRFPVQVPVVIGGSEVALEKVFPSTNPNDPQQQVGIVSEAGVDEARAAIEAAREAFAGWRDTDPRERAEYLFRAARVARRMRYELAALQVYEVGKAWGEADGDVCEAIDFLEYYGREMIRLGHPRRMGPVPGEVSELFYEPRGVGVVIAPWNFPLAISMGMTSAGLVTGNTIIYKPASQSPVVGSMVHRIFAEAGLPPGVLNFLPGPGGAIGDYLVTHPQVAFITFTGSREVGLRIVKLAGETREGAAGVKNVVAEMGGKNAIIVDSDADFDEAVIHVLQSAFGYQGQKCSACSRLIVLEENYDRLIKRLKEAAESLPLGPVLRPENMVGAVIDEAAREKIERYIEIGKQEGTLLLQRSMAHGRGHAVPMTIFVDVDPQARIAQEEIFGPLLAVIRVKDFDQALQVANSTRYALTGGVFSRSPVNIDRAWREFRVGNLYINRGCTGAVVNRHPFGGFKMSGVGSKAGGPDYLLQFMVPRNVVENTMRKGFAPLEEPS